MELNSVKKSSDCVSKYLKHIKEARDKLSFVGVQIDDKEVLHIDLKGLLAEYHSFSPSMRTKSESISFEEVHALLSTEEDLLKNIQELSKDTSLMAMAATKPNNVFPPTTTPQQYNGQNNHGRGRNQFNRGKGRRSFSNSSTQGGYNSGNTFGQATPNSQYSPNLNTNTRPTCQICYKQGHTALDCYQRMNFAYQGRQPPAKLAAMASATPSFNPQSSQNWPQQTTWILDTRATDHFTPDLTDLPDCSSYIDSQLVSVGNGQQLPISNISNAQLLTSCALFQLQKILHVPSMSSNLLYVYRFCHDNNCSFYFDAYLFVFRIVLRGNLFTQDPVRMVSTQFMAFPFLLDRLLTLLCLAHHLLDLMLQSSFCLLHLMFAFNLFVIMPSLWIFGTNA